MLALSDGQLAVVITAARGLPVEKRSVFLKRVAARLQLRGSLTDLDSMTPQRAPYVEDRRDHDLKRPRNPWAKIPRMPKA